MKSAETNQSLNTVIDEHDAYLQILGKRVRSIRAQRGMSRKILASSANISERYLAQLEAGQGNISISLLRQLACAMNIATEDLVRDGKEPSLEHTLIIKHLERIPEDAVSKIYAAIFGTDAELPARTNRIAMIGLRGAGKSTLGRALADRLGIAFVELVQEIEREAGMRINEIFSLSGQAGYRRFERQCLENNLGRFDRMVISVGGSLVSEASTYERLLSSCYTIWLQADPEQHMKRVIAQGDYRPMAGNVQAMDDLRRILLEREAFYTKADVSLNTSGDSVDESLQKLLNDPQIQNNLQQAGE